MYKAIIHVSLKKNVLDPQGMAIQNSLDSLGYHDVKRVRMGKKMELFIEAADRNEAIKQVEAIASTVLSNPVMEEFTYRVEEARECELLL